LGLPIALIGFRGSGKSTLGARLAAELKRPFFDLDREIEVAQGRTIAALFREEGEAAFRRIEAETLEGIAARPGIVLAPGGGAVELAESRLLLRHRCRSIYLDVPIVELVARLSAGGGRPALTELPLGDEVALVAARRDPLYLESAELVLKIAPGESEATTYSRLRELLANS